MEKEIIKQTEQNETPDNRRTVFIGPKSAPNRKNISSHWPNNAE